MVYSVSQTVNLLPLLTYQKIYYDFFSESQWEKHLAYSYNVDYWDGKSQLSLAPEMLQLRYANYPKDYFMGMLPRSQYGSVAVLPPSNSSFFLLIQFMPSVLLVYPLLLLLIRKVLRILKLVVPLLLIVDYLLIQTFPSSQSVRQNIYNVGKR